MDEIEKSSTKELSSSNKAMPVDKYLPMESGLSMESHENSRKSWDKVYPSESSIGNLEPPSPSFSGEGVGVHFPVSLTRSSDTSSSLSASGSPSRSDDEGDDQVSSILSIPKKYNFHSNSDLDLSVVSSRDVLYSEKLPKPLSFESDTASIWFPPPPEDVDDERENNLFSYDYDSDGVENSGGMYLGTSDGDVSTKDADFKEPVKPLVLEHFRSLLLQLLQAEKIEDGSVGEWLEVISAVAWQAAKYIKPDTSHGGSMDPCDYLKIKCIASGKPGDSKIVKGIVCSKNIKHKRMISQYHNPRLLILGGALEFQRSSSHSLASVQTLLQQENDHLDAVVSKIEALRPNVLLVENTVSSYALDKLFAKEISVVLNVKRSLLERVAKCTGASIIPSTDNISMARLGYCELFHLEKVYEDHEPLNSKKASKSLMFFEGCSRSICCTVLLKGSARDELKKVKRVMPYAVFAAYHLLRETSFLAAEAACYADLELKSLNLAPETLDKNIEFADSEATNWYKGEAADSRGDLSLEPGLTDYMSGLGNDGHDYFPIPDEHGFADESYHEFHVHDDGPSDLGFHNNFRNSLKHVDDQVAEVEASTPEEIDDAIKSSERSNDNNENILVSFSSNCMVNGSACERARLLRVKFYGPSDKPLGRYLRDDLFDQSYRCKCCNEPAESHVMCYAHQNANLTIKVRHLPTVKLPGEQDGKIWMWHRCLKCEPVDGVPPATKRVVLSDAAWGLSFGKFLELSFCNHVTGNRVAFCGHSLQRDCLRFFGYGSMVASFQYSNIDILSVRLPPPILEFNHPVEQSWIKEEVNELSGKAEEMFSEIQKVLEALEVQSFSGTDGSGGGSKLQNHFTELKDMLVKEKSQYIDQLQIAYNEFEQSDDMEFGSLDLNHLRDALSISSRTWDQRLSLLEDLKSKSYQDSDKILNDVTVEHEETRLSPQENLNEVSKDQGNVVDRNSPDQIPSTLFDSIDSAWSGDLSPNEDETLGSNLILKMNQNENQSVIGTTRIHSFDSLQTAEETLRKGPRQSSFYLTVVPHSFHASGAYKSMIRDPFSNIPKSSSQLFSNEADLSSISSPSLLYDGARSMARKNSVLIHDDELTSIISHALTSKEYNDWVLNRIPSTAEIPGISQVGLDSLVSDISSAELTSLDFSQLNYRSFVSGEQQSHLQISFEDDSSKSSGKPKYSVTCYFAREFDALRKICCPSETNFIRSLRRCRKWSAQGGKSNVYFAKTMDERFIVKQVTKTEMESFEVFGPEYFKYLTEALSYQSPTCLAKILGIYQVVVKGKKMDLMVMENLFFNRNISKVYDLKGSVRSRYISDADGTNKVLLDMNLLETVGKNPIFVGSKAKRSLERAIWNDTSFLASIDVMDYSLLVGVDEEQKELVMGIIDFMRQYTWDKHLETWVKASGFLGGPKNASPTVISPIQYKKRFRKAITSYFLTVPDQWTS